MATKLADLKSHRCSIPSRKVRIIGKIREFTEKESGQNSKPWITIQKHQGDDSASQKHRVFLESTSRKDGYELDYCYGQDEEIHQIYSGEIKPLIQEVFNGQNVSVIALGAKGSGKTYTIQGSQEKPGLAVLAMSEILMKAKELEKSVSVSLYELTQDHAYDLLNPEHPAVHVMEDAQGKINLKGLSQVPLNCISEFHNIYFGEGSSQNTQKMSMDQTRRHKGLMVRVSSKDDKLKHNQAKKINFVDLAGYEDPKKSSKDGITLAESNRTNKSLYALLNVVSALSANEIRVPYRESKLTRILQDSLGGTSHILLLTCLNPSFCQDSLSSINLVSRSCRSTKQILTDSTNRCQKDSAKFKVVSSTNDGKLLSASLTVKKQIGRSHLLHGKHNSCILKGRKLFEQEKTVNAKQLGSQSEDTSSLKSKILPNLALVVAPFSLEEAPQDKCISEGSPTTDAIEGVSSQGLGSKSMSTLQQTLIPSALDATNLTNTDVSSLGDVPQAITNIKLSAKPLMNYEAANKCEVNTLRKKNNASPPLSERIREISNNLKSLCASTPLKIKMQDEVVGQQGVYNDTMDPKTPVLEPNCGSCCSPHDTFGDRSSRIKHSLVKEYLSFLNSANKEELKSVKGIGEKRATYILELREESPEPFKSLDDLQDIGLSAKQIKGMMKQVAGELFI